MVTYHMALHHIIMLSYYIGTIPYIVPYQIEYHTIKVGQSHIMGFIYGSDIFYFNSDKKIFTLQKRAYEM